jgi:molybdopterin/thiamine biosynthesis adenylyltransferase
LDLSRLQEDFPSLIPEPKRRAQGATAYGLRLPEFPAAREFAWAELLLARGFPEHAVAKIMLSPDAVMRVPHVDSAGLLCVEGDPGPGRGYSAEDRLYLLLLAYQEQFLEPWLAGRLDEDFLKEPLEYWRINVSQARSDKDPVRSVWTIDACPQRPTVREGLLVLPGRIVIAGTDDHALANRFIRSLGSNAKQLIRVLIADIPISYPFIPSTWPRSTADLDRLLTGRLGAAQREQFLRTTKRRGREMHRIVLLRNPAWGFAYLLAGGPPTVVDYATKKRAFPARRTPQPLTVVRADPLWTEGRDQHREVAERQARNILVLGAGALGSPVVEHLAKAGVGRITLVDPDHLVPANLGRHLLGADSVGERKAEAVAQQVNLAHPSTVVIPCKISAERWLLESTLAGIDLVLDLTGDQDVRWYTDEARRQASCPLLIGWMEPFVAAAHVCILPAGAFWMDGPEDPMRSLEAVDWPDEVVRQEPGCSSRFQSYTAAAAAHAVALVTECALKMIDGTEEVPKIVSWVRGRRFRDEHWPTLELKEWAQPADPHDGLVMERSFP